MKLFSLDTEVNGLYGSVFAIGVTVRDKGVEIAQFQGRLPDSRITHSWGITRALPAITSMPVTHKISSALEESFWEFWMKHRKGAQVITHCGSPAESGLFRHCVQRDLETRQYQGPYPAMHDAATLLELLGEPGDSVDVYAAKYKLEIPFVGQPHHPLYDAIVTAVVWEHAWERLRQERANI